MGLRGSVFDAEAAFAAFAAFAAAVQVSGHRTTWAWSCPREVQTSCFLGVVGGELRRAPSDPTVWYLLTTSILVSCRDHQKVFVGHLFASPPPTLVLTAQVSIFRCHELQMMNLFFFGGRRRHDVLGFAMPSRTSYG